MNKLLLALIFIFGTISVLLYFQVITGVTGSSDTDEEIARLRIQNAALEGQIKALNKLVIKNKDMLSKMDGAYGISDTPKESQPLSESEDLTQEERDDVAKPENTLDQKPPTPADQNH
ncbi:hypothetical protein TDB9533_00723 [Thalassocella blandensis]|nr:hypothetical protein TDB9533_00723 [Thalassocella blandensis]